MTWNGPVQGDYTGVDFTKGPWAGGIMTLSHDECIHVLDACKPIIEDYDPKNNMGQPISDMYVQSRYNELDWQYAINGDTYAVIKGYNPEVNELGINESGIIQPEPEQLPEEPTEEPPAEEEPTEQ